MQGLAWKGKCQSCSQWKTLCTNNLSAYFIDHNRAAELNIHWIYTERRLCYSVRSSPYYNCSVMFV